MADSRFEAYADKLTALTQRAVDMPAAARRAVVKQLQEVAGAIRADLAGKDLTMFSSARLQALASEVDRKLASFATAAAADIATAQKAIAIQAAKDVSATVSEGVGMVPVHPLVDTRMLTIAQGYSADLITNLSHDTAGKINGALRRGALGGTSMLDLVQQIGGALEGGKFSGLFTDIGDRAETITLNETLRMHSLSSMATISDLSKRHDGNVDKEWFHIPAARIPRLAHIAASGQVKPVDEPFLVGGEALMFPRDPNGSAGNTINCHCLVRPKVREALLKPSDQQRELLKRLGLSVTTTH